MIYIVISPAIDRHGQRLHGQFAATLAGRRLCTSREPLLAASRILLAEGVGPATPIATRHTGDDHDAMLSTVGAAAKWTVSEGNTEGPTFRRWEAYPARALHAPMRFSRRPVPDTGRAAERLAGAAP